tara:strand:+ start:1377 stop:1817 length:441 start_codon:yes stop_codon:yes gene_type:complete
MNNIINLIYDNRIYIILLLLIIGIWYLVFTDKPTIKEDNVIVVKSVEENTNITTNVEDLVVENFTNYYTISDITSNDWNYYNNEIFNIKILENKQLELVNNVIYLNIADLNEAFVQLNYSNDDIDDFMDYIKNTKVGNLSVAGSIF